MTSKLKFAIAASAGLHALLLATPLGAWYLPTESAARHGNRIEARIATPAPTATAPVPKPVEPSASAPETVASRRPGTLLAPGETDRAARAVYIPELPTPDLPPGGAPGPLVMKVIVDPLGRAERVETVRSAWPADLVEQLREALLRGRFTPATLDGRPVRSWTLIEFHAADAAALPG